MVQHATPTADITNDDDQGSGLGPWWSDELGGFVNIYRSIAQSAPPIDTVFINDTVVIPPLPGGSKTIYVTRLSSVSDPGIDTGHVIHIRGMRSVAATVEFQIRQGYVSEASPGTLIESFSPSFDIFQQTFDLAVSAASVALITNYGSLYVRVLNVGDSIAFISWIDLEVPDPATRAIVSWVVLEVPRDPTASLVTINKIKNFNGPKLEEELAAGDLSPDALVFAGFDIQANGYLWVPSATAKDVPPDGIAQPADLRFYYPYTLTAADLAALDAILIAHDSTILTSDQQLEADNAAAIAVLALSFPDFAALRKDQQVGLLRVFLSGIAVAAPDGKRYTRLVTFAGS